MDMLYSTSSVICKLYDQKYVDPLLMIWLRFPIPVFSLRTNLKWIFHPKIKIVIIY